MQCFKAIMQVKSLQKLSTMLTALFTTSKLSLPEQQCAFIKADHYELFLGALILFNHIVTNMKENHLTLLKISLLVNLNLVGFLIIPTFWPALTVQNCIIQTMQAPVKPKLVVNETNLLHEPQLQLQPQRPVYPKFTQRGDYWVAYNKIPSTKVFHGNESITLTTQSDRTYLNNLIPLVERWQGPISYAVYSPGSDYLAALKTIHYLRECQPLVKLFVTFHLFFHRNKIPAKTTSVAWEWIEAVPVNCKRKLKFGRDVKTYRNSSGLQYPINVARNIARESALTYFVLPSDVELYPSTNLIPEFLTMVTRKNSTFPQSSQPKVFVLPVFELHENVTSIPRNKTELKSLLDAKLAIPFHQNMCNHCHSIPKMLEWTQDINATQLKTFSTLKREGKQASWEPFYIGTNEEPVFDERVTWEGKNNKKIQAFAMCLLNYDFHVLNNAFLVHKPGIKKKFVPTNIYIDMLRTIDKTIGPELEKIYGTRQGCRYLT